MHSPYLIIGNCPILCNDINGDVFDPQSQKGIDEHKDLTKGKLAENQKTLDHLNTVKKSREEKGKSTKAIQKELMKQRMRLKLSMMPYLKSKLWKSQSSYIQLIK